MVTFLLTDVEGSTRLWEERPDEMAIALAAHDAALADVMRAHNGELIKSKGEGDATFSVFDDPADAIAAGLAAQRKLADAPFRVRVAIHTGNAEARDGDYFGPTVNRCARLRGAAHGGQVILSFVTRQLAGGRLPAGATLLDLGLHHLKDLTEPERVFQLCHADLRADFPPLASLDRRRHNLPAQLTGFVGRDEELRDLYETLGTSRMVTLVGPGGVGKTRLAVEAALRRVDTARDGVWFIDLSHVSDDDEVLPTVTSALGVTEEAGRSLVDALTKHMQDRDLVAVIDNCEHVVDAVAEVATTILQAGAEARVLATSRQLLGVPGERAFQLAPFTVDDAVALFEARAGDGHDADAVLEVCRRLDGLPLAIELAAALTDRMSVGEIAARLTDRLELLTGGGGEPRQRSLAAAIDWSYELLGDRGRDALAALSVFPAGFDLHGAEAVVSGHAVKLVGELVGASLVVHQHGRYSMLDSIRTYAAERLAGSGRAGDVNDRLVGWALDLLATGDTDYIDAEHINVVAAVGWAMGRDADAALRLVNALAPFWSTRGHWSLGRRLLDDVLARSTNERTGLRASALNHAGRLAARQGDMATAEHLYLESLDLAEEVGEEVIVDDNLVDLGRLAHLRGDASEAQTHFDASLAIARRLGDAVRTAGALSNLGVLSHARGDLADARDRYEEAVELLEAAHSSDGLAAVLSNLGMVLRLGGDAPGALQVLERALSLAREDGDVPQTSKVLSELSVIAMGADDMAAARRYLEESLAINVELGNRAGEANCHYFLSEIARADRDLAAAREHATTSLDIWRALGHRLGEAAQLLGLADISFDERDRDESRRLASEALVLFVELDSRDGLATALERIATLVADDTPGRAAVLLGAVANIRDQMGAKRDSDVATQTVADTLRARLGGDFAAAFERGRMLTPADAAALAADE